MPLIVSDEFPDVVPVWQKREVLIKHSDYRGEVRVGDWEEKVVYAGCFGALVVHPCIRSGQEWKDRWTVSSVTTGWRLAHFHLKAAAEGFAEVLWLSEGCADALRHVSVRAIQRKMPQWVRWWSEACSAALTFVDPQPFQEKDGAMLPCLSGEKQCR